VDFTTARLENGFEVPDIQDGQRPIGHIEPPKWFSIIVFLPPHCICR